MNISLADLNRKIPKALFMRYRQVQASGAFNMMMDAQDVCQILNTDIDTYAIILSNYDRLCKLYLKK